jgi:hypothetical protein
MEKMIKAFAVVILCSAFLWGQNHYLNAHTSMHPPESRCQVGGNIGSCLQPTVWGPDASGCMITDNSYYCSINFCTSAVYGCAHNPNNDLFAWSRYTTNCGNICYNTVYPADPLILDPTCHTILNPPDVLGSDNGGCNNCTAPIAIQTPLRFPESLNALLPDTIQ